jgi:uncharacterized protein
MRMLRRLAFMLLLLPGAALAADGAVRWQGWSADLFQRAKAESRLVLLDMEAVWCHWCHVMDETTYADAAVAGTIAKHFIAVKVDQDAHPALSARYEDWGWPATVVFDADGNELFKWRGYVEPATFLATLQEVIADPSPMAKRSTALVADATGGLAAAERERMHARYLEAWDEELAGWGAGHKFLQVEPLDYAMLRARQGDAGSAKMARALLDRAIRIIDPVWGGMYQYSEAGSWEKPHYEKIMSIQAAALRLYAQAYAHWREPQHLAAAQAMYRFLIAHFRGPEGAFYTSQDADARGDRPMLGKDFYALDDVARRAAPLPRLDTNRYTRENGWAISALATLHDATGDAATLAQAVRAAEWVLAHRALGEGGFRHGAEDPHGPYLADNLTMGQALLDLYRSTGERRWLAQAIDSARFVVARFQSARGSFIASPPMPGAVGVLAEPLEHLDDNIAAVRWLNLLWHYTGDKSFRQAAERGMAWATARPEANRGAFWPGLLQADRELADDPVHLAVVGGKGDAKARALYTAALAYPAAYKRAEWWDRSEGPLSNPDIRYPEMDEAAAYGCANKVCSLPSFEPDAFTSAMDTLFARTARAQ